MKHQGAIRNLFTDVSNWKLKRAAQSQKITGFFLEEKRTGVPGNLNKGKNSNQHYFVLGMARSRAQS